MYYLVDTSNILYRGYYSSKAIWDDNPELHYLCKKLESLLQRKDAIICLCLDGYLTKGKMLMNEKYKEGRHQEDSYNIYEGLSSFIKLLHNDRIKVFYNKHLEADEVIFTLSKKLEGRKKILSSDKDIFQALSEDVVIDNGSNYIISEESYKLEYAEKFFGIEPARLPIYRAITGDASDTLKPPVLRFPHKLAAKISKEVPYNGTIPSIEDIKNISKDYSSSELKWINKLIECYQAFNVNFEIMKLNVVDDSLDESYDYKEVELSPFLKSKIIKLNNM